MITLHVIGTPRPGGSKSLYRGHIAPDNPRTIDWRSDVKNAVMLAYPLGKRTDPILLRGPVRVGMIFTLPRPQSAKKGARPAKKPDLDKLCRSTIDALTEMGVWEDDSRVVEIFASKWYPGDDTILRVPGCVIEIGIT